MLKEYQNDNSKENPIIALSPAFENIENIDIVFDNQGEIKGKSAYTEQFHLEDINEVILATYKELKEKLVEKILLLNFNSQRYYISLRMKRNFAFLKIRKKKIGIIVMLDEKKIREKISKHTVSTLSEGVQNFYNGPCARIEVIDNKNLDEVINLLVEIQK